ncbi:hypothetical protein DL765_002672 [Monosporascus sp. GIB2]|nr:hypothetical protein DL765_002672 [Monosporascus sp. GIB2]
MAEITSTEQLIPWPWAVTPLDPDTHSCPSTTHILVVFGVVNVICAYIAIILGNRTVIRWLTRGVFGQPGVSSWVYVSWIASAGLILAANALNAWLTVRAPGYDQSRMPTVGDLTLFYVSRPRIAWIWVLVLGLLPCHWRGNKDNGLDWRNAAIQTTVAEIVLQLIGVYYKARAVHFASRRGLYGESKLDRIDFVSRAAFAMMTTAATVYMCILAVIAALLFYWLKYKPKFRTLGWMYLCTAGTYWILDWVFMAGYVKLAGDLFCPQQFALQGAIWAIFTIIGLAIGGAI